MKRTDKKFLKLVGSKLREHRIARMWTLEKVAKKSKLSTSIIQKYEDGKVSIPLVKLKAHCKALSIDIGALINEAAAKADRRQ